MSNFPSQLLYLGEPVLEFGSQQLMAHPRSGLALFGPFSSTGIDQPRVLSYAVVGSKLGIEKYSKFSKMLTGPVLSPDNMDEVLWPHFPGFEETFHAVLPDSDGSIN